MTETLKCAIVGLDTSHATEFPKFMQDPTMEPEFQVKTLRATRDLRFATPFQPARAMSW